MVCFSAFLCLKYNGEHEADVFLHSLKGKKDVSSHPGKVKLKGMGMKCFFELGEVVRIPDFSLNLGVNITVQINCSEEHYGIQKC